MKKTFFVTACAVAFAVPLITLAAFTRPSEVMTFLANTEGHPRDFNVKMYAQATEDDGTPIHLFAIVSGSSEGATVEDMKMTMHADVTADFSQGTLKTGIDLMAYQQKLYGRMTNIAVSGQGMGMEDASMLDAANAQYANRWFSLDASPEASASGDFWKDFAEINDLPASPGELQAIVNDLLDAVFDLNIERFRAGHAYLLTQRPHAVSEAVQVLSRVFADREFADPAMRQLVEEELSTMDFLNDPDLQDMEDEINRTFALRAKVDVSNEGTFQFARMHMTFSLPEEDDFFFSIEGSVQGRAKPVYLGLPRKTERLEDVFGDFFPSIGMPTGPMPMETEDEWWMLPGETEELPSVERPVYLRVPSAECSPDGSVRGADLSTQELCPGGHESRRSLRRRLEE